MGRGIQCVNIKASNKTEQFANWEILIQRKLMGIMIL